MRVGVVRALCLGLAVTAASGCAVEESARPDLLLITVDTLRADRVSLYGHSRPTTPSLERWFGDQLVYERAYSTEASTSPSVVSLLSGRLPEEHRVRLFYQLLSDDVPVLPDLLPPEYQSAGVVSNMVLTDEALGLASRFDHYDDQVDSREGVRAVWERDAETTTDAALRWWRDRRDPTRPSFFWVHYIDPHGPYRPPKGWPRFATDEREPIDVQRIPQYVREEGVDDAAQYKARYDEEVAYADREVGRLLEGVLSAPYWEAIPSDRRPALALFTSDHGESFLEHDLWFRHGHHVYEEVVRVPLLLGGVGVEPGRATVPVSGVDVASTLIRAAGGTVPEGLDDVDLRKPDGLSADRLVFVESSQRQHQWRAVLQGARKVLVRVRGNRRVAGAREFDLARDPGELDPRPVEESDALLARLAERIGADPDPAGVPDDFRRGIRLTAPKVAPGVSEEDLERLKALGYVQ